jgi:hypothetical protein
MQRDFSLVKPRGVLGRIVKADPSMLIFKPASGMRGDVSRIVVENVVYTPGLGQHLKMRFQHVRKLLALLGLGRATKEFSSRNIDDHQQQTDTMTHILKLAPQRTSGASRHIGMRASQQLNTRLFIEAENRLVRGVEPRRIFIVPKHVLGLGVELRVVTGFPVPRAVRLTLCALKDQTDGRIMDARQNFVLDQLERQRADAPVGQGRAHFRGLAAGERYDLRSLQRGKNAAGDPAANGREGPRDAPVDNVLPRARPWCVRNRRAGRQPTAGDLARAVTGFESGGPRAAPLYLYASSAGKLRDVRPVRPGIAASVRAYAVSAPIPRQKNRQRAHEK